MDAHGGGGVAEDVLDDSGGDALGGEEAAAGVAAVVHSAVADACSVDGASPGLVDGGGADGVAGDGFGDGAVSGVLGGLVEDGPHGVGDGDGADPGFGFGDFSADVELAVLDVVPGDTSGFARAEAHEEHEAPGGEVGVLGLVGGGEEVAGFVEGHGSCFQ